MKQKKVKGAAGRHRVVTSTKIVVCFKVASGQV